jgi:hypothetical protein
MENNSSPRSQAQSLLFIAFLVKISAMIRSMIIEMTVIKIQFFILSQILPVDVNPVSQSGVMRNRPAKPSSAKVIQARALYATPHGLGFDRRYVWLINWCPEIDL